MNMAPNADFTHKFSQRGILFDVPPHVWHQKWAPGDLHRMTCDQIGQLQQKGASIFPVFRYTVLQGIDGSARKPALKQDTGYMVEKTFHDIAPYLVAFGAYLLPK